METIKMLELLYDTYPSGKCRIDFKEDGSRITLVMSRRGFKDELNPLKPIRVVYGTSSVFAISSPEVALEFIELRGFSKETIHKAVKKVFEEIVLYFKEVNDLIVKEVPKEILETSINNARIRVEAINEELEKMIMAGSVSRSDLDRLLNEDIGQEKPKLSLVKDDIDKETFDGHQ